VYMFIVNVLMGGHIKQGLLAVLGVRRMTCTDQRRKDRDGGVHGACKDLVTLGVSLL
jgi:hypothetical protein